MMRSRQVAVRRSSGESGVGESADRRAVSPRGDGAGAYYLPTTVLHLHGTSSPSSLRDAGGFGGRRGSGSGFGPRRRKSPSWYLKLASSCTKNGASTAGKNAALAFVSVLAVTYAVQFVFVHQWKHVENVVGSRRTSIMDGTKEYNRRDWGIKLQGRRNLKVAWPEILLRRFARHRRRAGRDHDRAGVFYHPDPLDMEHLPEDYGGIAIYFFEYPDTARAIYHDYDEDQSFYLSYGAGDDNNDYYYAFDDDERRNPYNGYDDDSIMHEKKCRRTSWHRDVYLNCNSFHELDFKSTYQEQRAAFLGEGSYRQVFAVDVPADKIVVFKEAQWLSGDEYGFGFDAYEFMRMEMVVAETFSSNDRFVDIYGFCALSMFSEFMANGDMDSVARPEYRRWLDLELHDEDDVDPKNNLSPTEKLSYALQMAELIAFLHNHDRGVIVHDDIQLSQFLLADDTSQIKLNDFNRNEIMLWDEEHGEYCKYRNNPGHGDWRAPEEYLDAPLDEKIDIWSLANNFYALLTGLSPYYEEEHLKDVQKRVTDGEMAYIDPRYKERSYAEGKLVEIIEKCWVYEPEQRIDIATLVTELRDAIEENDRLILAGNEH